MKMKCSDTRDVKGKEGSSVALQNPASSSRTYQENIGIAEKFHQKGHISQMVPSFGKGERY